MQHATRHKSFRNARQRGVAAMLAMLFLVIFGSLATAMAIVAQGNLRTADSHLKMNRSLAAADTGVRFMLFRLDEVLRANPGEAFSIAQGEVDAAVAATLWPDLAAELQASFLDDGVDPNGQHLQAPFLSTGTGGYLRVGPIRVAPGEPIFTAVLMQHPIPAGLSEGHPFFGHNYASDYYQRPPYDASDASLRRSTGITTPVSAAAPLDQRWVRLRVTAIDGPFTLGDAGEVIPGNGAVSRTVSMDLKIEKKLEAAILSKSRVMIGRNVMIDGNIGSQFTEVNLLNGHPIQMESDFRGIDPDTSSNGLDAQLDSLKDDLISYDANGDNRLAVATEVPFEYRDAYGDLDIDADGYVDEWDLFLNRFDSSGDNAVSRTELDTTSHVERAQLWQLINEMKFPPGTEIDWAGKRIRLPGNPDWMDAADDLDTLDADDRYAKIRGEVVLAASKENWENGAAGGSYQDYLAGPIHAGYDGDPLTFEADESAFPSFDQKDFDVSQYADMADGGDLLTQAADQAAGADPTDPNAPKMGETTLEEVPYGSNWPYDHYERPVFRNMTFTDLRIPKGSNALFVNCTFKGVTYVETHTGNFMEYTTRDGERVNAFNYSGRQDRKGELMHPDIDEQLRTSGSLPSGVTQTKQLGNNIRFDGCRFEGVVVSGGTSGSAAAQPDAFSHTRNKLTFTGNTEFPDVTDRNAVPDLTAQERDTFRRGRIITPHMSIEMGTFVDPSGNGETVHLTGTVVAGLIDMRGQVDITGTVMTTYEPTSNDGTVMGETSPQFNTTLGYFSRDEGDMEGERPPGGRGIIKLKYDPSLPLPDGIMARVDVTTLVSTYFEGSGL